MDEQYEIDTTGSEGEVIATTTAGDLRAAICHAADRPDLRDAPLETVLGLVRGMALVPRRTTPKAGPLADLDVLLRAAPVGLDAQQARILRRIAVDLGRLHVERDALEAALREQIAGLEHRLESRESRAAPPREK